MNYAIIFSLLILLFSIFTYDKWSYLKWSEKCEKEIIPFTGKRKDEFKNN